MSKTCTILEYILIFTALFSLLCLYSYRKIPINHISYQIPDFFLQDPFSEIFNERQSLGNYSRLIDRDFGFIEMPRDCVKENILIVFLVHSETTNFVKRDMIRKTWGGQRDWMRVVFVLGQTNDTTVAQDINEESNIYNDLMVGNFRDTYRSLSYKHVMGLKWAASHCARARYVIKTDDDLFVNLRELVRFLTKELSPWGARNLIGCKTVPSNKVERDKTSKWYVPHREYPADTFPTYCSGFLIIYSQDVVSRIVSYSEKVRYFPIDDVYVTGILAEKLGIARSNIQHFCLPLSKSGRYIVVPMNSEPDAAMEAWDAVVGNKTLLD